MNQDCDNGFSDRILLSYNQSLVIAVMNMVIMLLTTTANTVIIVGLIKTKQLDSKVNRMFLGLSISDVCIALIVQPLVTILFTFQKHIKSCKLELATQFFSLLFCHSSAFLIVAIAIERLINVREIRAREYIAGVSYTRIHGIIVCCFAVALCVSTAVTVSSLHGRFIIASVVVKLVDFLALMLIYTAYIETFRAVYRHVKSTQMLRNGTSAPSYASSMLKAIMLIIFFLFVCYMPHLCIGLVVFNETVLSNSKTSPSNAFLLYITYELVYLNSFFNAVVVLHKNRSLLKYVMDRMRIFSKKRLPTPQLNNKTAPIGVPFTVRLDDIQARFDNQSRKSV